MNQVAYSLLPITYQGLVVENTTLCNARCAMCYQGSGPKGSDTWGKASLAVEEVERVLVDALKVPTLRRKFHLAGGEAFLRVPDVIRLFRAARQAGYTEISTVTNAYWATRNSRAFEVCEQARDAGLTSIEISWDFWHQPYIKPEAISNCLEACAAYSIKSNLRILTTMVHSVEEALAALTPEALATADEISSGPVFPTGRAATEVDKEEIFYWGDLGSTCHSVLNLTVNARGDVYPCCAGADQTDWLRFGNIRDKPIHEIAEYMNSSSLLRSLVFLGVGTFVPILKDAGIDIGDRFSNICHLCFSIFSTPESAKVIHDHFDNLEQQAFQVIVEKLRESLDH